MREMAETSCHEPQASEDVGQQHHVEKDIDQFDQLQVD
jgi:hypothetical protein